MPNTLANKSNRERKYESATLEIFMKISSFILHPIHKQIHDYLSDEDSCCRNQSSSSSSSLSSKNSTSSMSKSFNIVPKSATELVSKKLLTHVKDVIFTPLLSSALSMLFNFWMKSIQTIMDMNDLKYLDDFDTKQDDLLYCLRRRRRSMPSCNNDDDAKKEDINVNILLSSFIPSSPSYSSRSSFNEIINANNPQGEHSFSNLTQIDVSRMAMNASRHFDVDSIWKLPTFVYNKATIRDSTTKKDKDSCLCGDGIETIHDDGNNPPPPVVHVDTTNDAGIVSNNGSEISLQSYNTLNKGKYSLKDDVGWSWIDVPKNIEEFEGGDKSNSHILEPNDVVLDEEKNSVIDLPATSNTVTEKETTVDQCVICLEIFQDGDRVRALPCQHFFHIGCIDKWLVSAGSSSSYLDCFTSGCPTCQQKCYDIEGHELVGVISNDNISYEENNLDGSVPSWAFAKLGDSLAKQL